MESSRSSDMMRNISRVPSQIAETPTPSRSNNPPDGRKFVTPARRAPLQASGTQPGYARLYDHSRSCAMMKTILRVSSEIAETPTPVYYSNWSKRSDGMPVRRARFRTVETQRLDPESKSQCSEISTPDKPSMDKPPSPDGVTQSDTSIADYVSDKMQQPRPAPARKSQSQLESDAESKQKQINRVFMNLKIAEKVRLSFSKLNYECMLELVSCL